MSTKTKTKRVSFSAADQVISFPSPDSSSESDSEDLRVGMKGLALEGIQEDVDPKAFSKSTSYSNRSPPPHTHTPIPPTPRLRPRELPADDSSQSESRRVAASSHASPASTASTLSPRPRHASNVSSSNARSASHTSKPTNSHMAHTKSSAADDSLSLILSTLLTSGDPYAWDITIDPRTRSTRVSRMLDNEGDLPAAHSALSQGRYEGELVLQHKAISSGLGIKPRNGAQYVTVRDVFESIYAFMRARVSDHDISAEGKQRQGQIIQAAIARSRNPRPEVRRVDWLLGNTTFCGLSLGKDGETINLLTGAGSQRL